MSILCLTVVSLTRNAVTCGFRLESHLCLTETGKLSETTLDMQVRGTFR